jgi:hypothetical protein
MPPDKDFSQEAFSNAAHVREFARVFLRFDGLVEGPVLTSMTGTGALRT